ncbi:putative UDP-rhamnose:rhamnosyltransferase 1 [Dichanthelium oligosanthes]|uniref:Putative UDP-rhamnose:rhamnosyltransferase 1 n=1 Tax=Dichanthelium oligosanthes TaxID=888268 RepID=A0A1E5W013_9POAL|nr:putative UDP-rhamnose:rhamnosyltransferase 1 [Dichanthelium oligosanthes]
MGRGKYVRTKPEHLTGVPDYVPFPTTVAYRGFEARAFFEPAFVADDSGVSEAYRFGKSIEGSQLVVIRSSTEFEPEWLQVLGELYQKPVIPVGLFPPPPTQDVGGQEATLQWLERQAPGSVVYAAFGSEAKQTCAQLETIALGLEASGLPFLWAYRPPIDAYEGKIGLPEGFEERINGRGLVCCGWVPQARYLAHESVGAFLTHAGWNSITEGLARGVKLVLLPLLFDQGPQREASGGEGIGAGNFMEMGPLDTDMEPRNSTWLQKVDLIFVDNPVGVGYSYMEEDVLLVTTDWQAAADLTMLLKALVHEVPTLQSSPFCSLSPSPMEVSVVLEDSWISPEDYMLRGLKSGDLCT